MLVRLAGCFGRSRREREWAAEFESHLEMHIADNLRAGMSPEEARRRALVASGGIESVKESLRDQAGFAWLDTTLRDIRYALRGLRRSPAFAITTIFSLTLGLGASLAIFTIADNLLVRPLPYGDASRLVMVWEADRKVPGTEHNVVSPANYLDWKSQNDVLEGIAAASPVQSAVLVENGHAEEFKTQSVTADFFALLGVRPVRGRLFTAQEARVPGQVGGLISYRLWQSWFGGDENIIGRKVVINSFSSTIIGVLPPDFHFLNREVDLWAPLQLDPAEDYRKTSGRWMMCVARLKPSVKISQAQAHMAALARGLEQAYPAFNTNWGVSVESLRDALYPQTKTPLLVLLAAVVMLLAVACANVANLLLARYSSRTREMAVRASLGAGRWRVVRQLLTESLILGTAGGIFGVTVARWAVAGLMVLAPRDLAQSTAIHVDLRMVGFAVALSLLTGIVFGMAPALVTTSVDLAGGLRGGSASSLRAGTRLRAWLVGAEVAVSVILLAGALLLFRSLVALEGVNLGFDPSNVLTFRVSLASAHYMQDARLRTQFFARALDEIARLPGVRSASAGSFLPLTGPGAGTGVGIEGRPPAKPGEELTVLVQIVMPGYFHTLGIPLESGREFSEADNMEHSPYRFIVNEAFVRQYLRGEQPLGKRINVDMDRTNPFGEIIGVAGDTREWWIDREPKPTVYYVHAELNFPRMIFLVRVDHDPLSLVEPVRRLIQSLDPEQPIAEVRTMEDALGENFSRQRFSAWLLSGFAIVALMLAAVGIYGVLAYSVTSRTREFGVRAALGADANRIIALVLKSGVWPVISGLVGGVACAFASAGFLKSLLYGVAPRDPGTFVIAPCLLALVALIAALLPAHRAARLDPMQALRTD
jgi:putative ABC transport system permease protein